jgi:hypothetical protein
MPLPNQIVQLFQPPANLPPLSPKGRSEMLAEMLSKPQPKTPLSMPEGIVNGLQIGLDGFMSGRAIRQAELDKKNKAQALADALFGKADSTTGNVMDPRHDQVATWLENGGDPSVFSPMLASKWGLTKPEDLYDYQTVEGNIVRIDKRTGKAESIFAAPAAPGSMKAADLVQTPGPDGKTPVYSTAAAAVGKPAYVKPKDPQADIEKYEYYVNQQVKAGKVPKGIDEWDIDQRKAGASVINNTVGGETLTPGQKKIDEGFAEQYLAWVTAGGYADVDKQIAQLDEATAILKKNPGAVANPINAVGGIPFVGPGLQAWLNKDGTIASDKVGEVVQRNLRAILGAQFTESEGERLMARAFNANLDAVENIARIEKLTKQIRSMAQAKQAAADYFDAHGTLRGFTGKLPTKAEIDALDFDNKASAPSPVSNEVKTIKDKYGLE